MAAPAPEHKQLVETVARPSTWTERPARLAILTSHPIQYQAPLFRSLAQIKEVQTTVLFCSDSGAREYKDRGFGRTVKWDVPLLDGYFYEFVGNISPRPNVSTFFGLINPGVVKWIRRGEFDALLVHGWVPFTYCLAILAAIRLGVPVILRGESNLLSRPGFLKATLKRQILSRLFKHISAFVAIGHGNVEFYESYGVPKEKIFLAPYAVDNEFFISTSRELVSRKNELRVELGIRNDQPVILFVGKLSKVKAPTDLLKAFAQVRKCRAASLIFVGDGELRAQLEELARRLSIADVIFAGFRNQSEIGKFYAMADVFVLPSVFEPWGLVVNEAMCFGLPVIVSDCVGAARDMVRDGINGHVYHAGDVNSLADTLERVLADQTRRARMGLASRELVEANSLSKAIQGLQQALKHVTMARAVEHL